MPSNELTPEELEWAKRNAGAVRSAMAASGDRKSDDMPSDPVQKAAALLTRSITKKLGQIERKEGELAARIDRYRKLAACESPDIRANAERWLAEDLPRAEKEATLFEVHRKALEEKLSRLRDDPASCFLPIGTIVRFARSPSHRDSLGLTDHRKDYPVKGSVGVVTRLNYRDECFLGVTMRRDFKDGWGSVFLPDDDRMPTYIVDPEMLEVVGHATLPDGTEYKGYGFVETHEREDGFGGDDAEMILEADGFFWRLHDFGGTQGIECLQAYEDIAEMSWIKGPLPCFEPPSTGCKGGPHP